MVNDNRTEHAIVGFVYLFCAVICSAISAFSTYTGFRIFPGLVSAAISSLIFVLLLVCDVSILRARRNGGYMFRHPRTLLGPIIMLIVITIVSTSSSFTFFYSSMMRDRLAASRASSAADLFEANYSSARQGLLTVSSALSKENEISKQLTNLDTQVLHSGRPGFGDDAMRIIATINQILDGLGAPMTRMAFPPPPGSPRENDTALTRYKTAVSQNLISAESGDGVSPTIKKIQNIHASNEQVVMQARDETSKTSFDEHIEAIIKLKNATSDIERETNDVLATSNKPLIHLNAADIVGIRLYNAPEVYAVAFTNREGLPYTIGSLAFALILDLLPLLLAILLIHPSEQTTINQISPLSNISPDLNIRGSKKW